MGKCPRNFSLPDLKGGITIIAAGVGRRPKPVVKFAKDYNPGGVEQNTYPDGKITEYRMGFSQVKKKRSYRLGGTSVANFFFFVFFAGCHLSVFQRDFL